MENLRKQHHPVNYYHYSPPPSLPPPVPLRLGPESRRPLRSFQQLQSGRGGKTKEISMKNIIVKVLITNRIIWNSKQKTKKKKILKKNPNFPPPPPTFWILTFSWRRATCSEVFSILARPTVRRSLLLPMRSVSFASSFLYRSISSRKLEWIIQGGLKRRRDLCVYVCACVSLSLSFYQWKSQIKASQVQKWSVDLKYIEYSDWSRSTDYLPGLWHPPPLWGGVVVAPFGLTILNTDVIDTWECQLLSGFEGHVVFEGKYMCEQPPPQKKKEQIQNNSLLPPPPHEWACAMKAATALETSSDSNETVERNREETDKRASCGQGWNQSIWVQFTRAGNIRARFLKVSPTGLKQRTTWRLERTWGGG